MTTEEISEAVESEYSSRGSCHLNMDLSRNWIPRYLRRFFVAKFIIREFLDDEGGILDVGSGEGVLVNELQSIGYKNAKGVDPSAPLNSEFVIRVHSKCQ